MTATITPRSPVLQRTVAVHVPESRPVLGAAERLEPGSSVARHAVSSLAWNGRVDVVLHPQDPRSDHLAHDAAGPLAAITVLRVSGGTAAEIAGALDADTTPFVRDVIEIGLAAGGRCLYLHLAAVSSCDGAGVELIAELQRELRARGVGLVAVACPPAIRKVLWATATDGLLIEQDHLPEPLPSAWVGDPGAPESLVHW
jgi:anti-anti-sigma regulatory factor